MAGSRGMIIKAGIAGYCWLLVTGSAAGFEFGHLRPVQVGPVGHGYDLEMADGETEFSWGQERKSGWERSGNSMVKGVTDRRSIRFGNGMRIGPDFLFTFSLTSENTRFSNESSGLKEVSMNHNGHRLELAAGPVWYGRGLILGSKVRIHMHSGETRDFTRDSQEVAFELDGATWPTIEGSAGISGEDFILLATISAYNGARASATKTYDRSIRYDYQTTYRTPGSFHLDFKKRLGERIQIGWTWAWIASGQASEDVAEYSLDHTTGTYGSYGMERSGVRRHKDHSEFTFGGSYAPAPDMLFLGSLHYVEPFYAEDEYASILYENLGGTSLYIGILQKLGAAGIYGSLGYRIPNDHSYTYTDTWDHNWMDRRDEVEVEQTYWDILIGGSITI